MNLTKGFRKTKGRPADVDDCLAAGDPWLGPPDLPRPAAGPPGSEGDCPSRPGRPGSYVLHLDHPGWPARPDPRWAAAEAILPTDDHPTWPECQGPPWLDAVPPVPEYGAGSGQLASWIVTQANQQAAEIRQEARDQAATSLAEARREAADLIQRASDQATATLAAVEVQTAELRAAIVKLSAELSGVTGHVTENLLTSAPSATTSALQPVNRSVPEPAAEPKAAPESLPAAQARTAPAVTPKTEPAARSKTLPVALPKGRPRQYGAARLASIVTAALILFALASGTTEVALHGLSFFVFRSAGTGETPGSGLQENQGPGQPDAPGAHLHRRADAPAGHKAASSGTRES